MTGTTEFFSVSAQVIPVLFIAIAFEHRAFGKLDEAPEKDFTLAAARLFAFALILWGEVSALGAISASHPTPREHNSVSTALIVEAAMLSIEPILAFVRASSEAAPGRFERAFELTMRAVVLSVFALMGLLGILQIAQNL